MCSANRLQDLCFKNFGIYIKPSQHIGRLVRFFKVSKLWQNFNALLVHGVCRNPNLAKCGGEAQHLEKLGIWSPPGLPNVQSSTAGPKTPCIGVFLVSLERS
jgi:hypothetical protein